MIGRAFWIEEAGHCTIRTEPVRQSGHGMVRVESRYGAISRGTERLVFGGHVPHDQRDRMRGPHQGGDFDFPVKYGYAVVGSIVDGPPDRVGETIFCLHPHQDRFEIPPADVVTVPASVPAARAVLAANMETALNVVWDAGICAADRVAIVGGGVLGLLVAYLAARIPGTATTLVDIDPSREVLARGLGIGFASPGDAPVDCDVVVHASASEAGLGTAVEAAGTEGRIVEMSWYGNRPVSVELGGAFHSRRLSIVSSQVGAVPPSRRARWSRRRRLEAALGLLEDPLLDGLISGETAFLDLPGRYAAILDDPSTLCHRIVYS